MNLNNAGNLSLNGASNNLDKLIDANHSAAAATS